MEEYLHFCYLFSVICCRERDKSFSYVFYGLVGKISAVWSLCKGVIYYIPYTIWSVVKAKVTKELTSVQGSNP